MRQTTVAICKLKPPNSLSKLSSHLCSCNVIRQIVSNFARIFLPLSQPSKKLHPNTVAPLYASELQAKDTLKNPLNLLLCWNFHILVDAWHSTQTRAMDKLAASCSESNQTTRQTPLGTGLVCSLPASNRNSLRNDNPWHLSRLSYSSGHTSKVNVSQFNVTLIDLRRCFSFELDRRILALAPPRTEIWLWRYSPCCNKGSSRRRANAPFHHRTWWKLTREQVSNLSHQL